MSKKVRCELWLCGHTRMIRMGEFESIAKCRKYIDECVDGPYQIVRLPSEKQDKPNK